MSSIWSKLRGVPQLLSKDSLLPRLFPGGRYAARANTGEDIARMVNQYIRNGQLDQKTFNRMFGHFFKTPYATSRIYNTLRFEKYAPAMQDLEQRKLINATRRMYGSSDRYVVDHASDVFNTLKNIEKPLMSPSAQRGAKLIHMPLIGSNRIRLMENDTLMRQGPEALADLYRLGGQQAGMKGLLGLGAAGAGTYGYHTYQKNK